MKKGCWADNEVKDLFSQVESVKSEARPLKEAFIAHALKYKRKPNSVRNYYYYELENLSNDKAKTQKLGIDLSLHKKAEIEYFSSASQEKLIADIDKLIAQGYSIRRACFQLSGGDLNLMLRYQNKYRNFVQKQSKQPAQIKNNIIAFKKKTPALTENDFNSLFIGLVRLVKKSAFEEFSVAAKAEKENANAALRKALVDLTRREKEIEKLKDDFAKLKLENSRLVQKMMKMQIEKASDISQKDAKL